MSISRSQRYLIRLRTTEYSKEVRNYLYDSYPYTAAVWQMLKTLRTAPDGLPLAEYNITETEPEIVTWQVLEHLIM